MPHFQEYKERQGACVDCGNSPVAHQTVYFSATASVWISEIARDLLGNGTGYLGILDPVVRWIAETVDAWMFRFFAACGFVRYSHEVTKARSYRSQVIWEEAKRRGIPMEQIVFFGIYTDNYRAQLKGRWYFFNSIPLPVGLQQSAYFWIDDKYLLKRALRVLGIATPDFASATSLAQGRVAFERMGGTVIVKPRSGSRGRHTTTFVNTIEEFDRAFTTASQLCHYVAIERHLRGSVCRATVIRGKLAGFFKADAPYVMGDGESTIAQLIAKKNSHKPERVQDIVLREEHLRFIGRQGYSAHSVPLGGAVVQLSHRTGRLFGGETRELLATVHPVLREQIERAARGLNVPVVGFDLIIQDPETDPADQYWGIIEANSLPFIDLHYLPLHGEPSNPAAALWDLWK